MLSNKNAAIFFICVFSLEKKIYTAIILFYVFFRWLSELNRGKP